MDMKINYTKLRHSGKIGAAMVFAGHAHEGQVRKYTGEPYIVHPEAVAHFVDTVTADRGFYEFTIGGFTIEEMICAAWLHDTVEDCGIRYEQIEAEFGDPVAELVFWLTDSVPKSAGNRNARCRMQVKHLAAAPEAAKLIKLCDMLDNTKSIFEHDKKFAKVYLREKLDMVEAIYDSCRKDSILRPFAESVRECTKIMIDDIESVVA